MATIQFTMLARLNLPVILVTVKGDLEDRDRLLARKILLKIDVPLEESVKIAQAPEGIIQACANIPPTPIEMDEAEMQHCITLMSRHKGYALRDDDWARPLLASLRESMPAV